MPPFSVHRSITLPEPARQKLAGLLPSSRGGWVQGLCLVAGLTLPGGLVLLALLFLVSLAMKLLFSLIPAGLLRISEAHCRRLYWPARQLAVLARRQ
ncbi:MAG: hypothetical protein DRI34_08215 [Deltaproteobacteria bacterium]|nr:MAG: hypothetical protein DRI34_08215 [Deltaproteobacteria bacterium]